MQQQSYYCVVSSHLISNKDITPSAKLFYAFITSLMQKEGYCWATNEYLCNQWDVDERTIRRWLKSLKKSGYISVDLESGDYKTNRKIYMSDEFKKFLPEDKNVRPPGQKCPPPPDKNVRHINNSIINKEDKSNNVQTPKTELDPPTHLSHKMFNKIKELNAKALEPNYRIWNLEFDRMMRLDGRSFEEIQDMIDWVYDHDFWYKNILSPATLRKQWEKLCLQKNNTTNKGSRIKQNRQIAFTAKNALKRAGSGSEMMILDDRVVHALTNQFTNLDQDTESFISQISNIFNLERK